MAKYKILPVEWRWEYGVYVPFCPYCGEPAYQKDKCFFCGKKYDYVDGEYQPTEIEDGEWRIVQSTNNHIHAYQNGNCVYHAQRDRKMDERELRTHLKTLIAEMEKWNDQLR